MADCIDRAELLKVVDDDEKAAKMFSRGIDMPIEVMFDAVRDSIKDAPTITPEKERIGITELIYQVKRMCKSHNERCTKCPLGKYVSDNLCIYRTLIFNNQAEEAAKEVARWAASNKEKIYPTWEELQNENFPDARFPLLLCHFRKGICPKPINPILGACETCRKQPIPADIAERLGVKPKEEKQ